MITRTELPRVIVLGMVFSIITVGAFTGGMFMTSYALKEFFGVAEEATIMIIPLLGGMLVACLSTWAILPSITK